MPKGDPFILSGEHGEILHVGETRGGVGKMAFWRTKAAISLKRVGLKMEEKLLWIMDGLYELTNVLSSGTIPDPGLPFLESSRLGVCNLATPSYLRNG